MQNNKGGEFKILKWKNMDFNWYWYKLIKIKIVEIYWCNPLSVKFLNNIRYQKQTLSIIV